MTAPLDQPFVTYAQNREDLYLWALVGHRQDGRYVDVGCNHERLHSVTRLFYDRGWSGLDIDANERMAPEYARRDRDIFVVSGVGETSGELVFREYPRHDGLSTFDEVVKKLHDPEGRPFVDRIVEIRTLAEILAEHDVTRIDFLKIDVEGLEGAVLRGVDFEAVRPSVIVVEASRQDDCNAVLLPLDYRIEFFDGLNTYYVDAGADDVSIQNFAGRVLGAGFYTDAEWRMKSRMDALRGRVLVRAALRVGRPVRSRLRRRRQR
jgi:FkbM family methyltransferase